MSPSIPIRRLRAEIASDRAVFAELLAEIASVRVEGAGRPELAQLAVALHHAYGAVEAILQRVARQIEGELPEGPDWHQALLADMALVIEGVRPAVLERDTSAGLRRLLAFQHFFRHAYAVGLDPVRLGLLQRDALDLAPALARDLDAFDAWLAALAEAAGPC